MPHGRLSADHSFPAGVLAALVNSVQGTHSSAHVSRSAACPSLELARQAGRLLVGLFRARGPWRHVLEAGSPASASCPDHRGVLWEHTSSMACATPRLVLPVEY